ncbi:hypothetical protein QQ045_010629 [Rhodiola kirilowii]
MEPGKGRVSKIRATIPLIGPLAPQFSMGLHEQASNHDVPGMVPRAAHHEQQPPLLEKRPTPEELIFSVASNVASQPLLNFNPDVWGVLTAINNNACKRRQGINVFFTAAEHCIGRLVPDKRFQIEAASVSANHCKIYRKGCADNDVQDQSKPYVPVFIKDTSTNGTYLNREKLTKKGPEAELHHGDIVSFVGPPHHDNSYAFVYREVLLSASSSDDYYKRKSEECHSLSKRLKGIGIGAPEGPLSLDDFKSLQRSNAELRKQLDCHVLTIETLRNDNRAALEYHEKETKDLKRTIEQSYINQVEDLNNMLEAKKHELETVNKTSAEQKTVNIDLNERLNVSSQSCAEANEIINNQKASIAELKAQLDKERDQRRQDREKAAVDLKAAVQKVLSEANHELTQFSEAASRREKEQQELISKHQESGKELSLLVETLRTKLEDHRQKIVTSDNKVRQLEAKISEEHKTSADRMKKIEELEDGLKRLMEGLQSEKSAREEAREKVSNLELQMNAAMHDLEYERRKLKGARERIMLRETQLRAFYSTTEEISGLLVKQQDQLKSMQKTLEDEENYENASVDSELSPVPWRRISNALQEKQTKACQSNSTEAGSSALAQRNLVKTFSQDITATEKQDCDVRTSECQHTQEVDSANADPFVKGGFGSAINGEIEPVLDINLEETEQVMETECQTTYVESYIDMNKWAGLAGETMPDDEHAPQKDVTELAPVMHEAFDNHTNNIDVLEDTEVRDVITTQDLMASEVIGSWACSTAPSVHDENYSQKSKDNDNEGVVGLMALYNSSSQAESQNDEHYALSRMIRAVSSDLKDQLSEAQENDYMQGTEINKSTNNSYSEGADNSHRDNEVHAALSDVEVADSENEDDDDTPCQPRLKIDDKVAEIKGASHTQQGDAMEEDNPQTQDHEDYN